MRKYKWLRLDRKTDPRTPFQALEQPAMTLPVPRENLCIFWGLGGGGSKERYEGRKKKMTGSSLPLTSTWL